jgi:hypothetical protein
MTTDTRRDIRAISTSTDESIPSPRTARLPECIPPPILRAARQRFPAKAVIAARFMMPALPVVPGTDKVDSDKGGITPYKTMINISLNIKDFHKNIAQVRNTDYSI